MLRVGLTGGIGAARARCRGGWRPTAPSSSTPTLLAREVVAPGTPGLAAVVAAFGAGRAAARRLAWTGTGWARSCSPTRRCAGKLNAIVHPLVGQRMRELERRRRPGGGGRARRPAARRERARGAASTWSWSSTCARDVQRDRLTRHRGMTADAGRGPDGGPGRAGRSGWPSPTIVVDNSGSLAELDREAGAVGRAAPRCQDGRPSDGPAMQPPSPDLTRYSGTVSGNTGVSRCSIETVATVTAREGASVRRLADLQRRCGTLRGGH